MIKFILHLEQFMLSISTITAILKLMMLRKLLHLPKKSMLRLKNQKNSMLKNFKKILSETLHLIQLVL